MSRLQRERRVNCDRWSVSSKAAGTGCRTGANRTLAASQPARQTEYASYYVGVTLAQAVLLFQLGSLEMNQIDVQLQDLQGYGDGSWTGNRV